MTMLAAARAFFEQQRILGPMFRLIWYVLFSVGVVAVLSEVRAPTLVIDGYVVITAVGFVMAARAMRTAARNSRDSFRREMYGARDRLVARVADAEVLAKTQPWYEEVNASQMAAIVRGAGIFSLFTTFNPYWSLSFESLVRYGIATQSEIDRATHLARTSPPDAWKNGFMVSELEAGGYSEEEALARIGLFKAWEAARR